MRVLVIHNPASGPRSDDIYMFMRSLLGAGDEIVLRATTSGSDGLDITSDAAEFDAVVASGGDGTVARVAYAIRESGTPLLVFPSGTANLLAGNIGNAQEPAALAKTLREGKTATFDMGELTYRDDAGQVRTTGFHTMAGAGFDASIMKGSESLKPMFGQLSYYLAALGNPMPTYSHMKVTLDGETIERDGILVLVGVWGTVNPGFELIPQSKPDDGLLDVAIVNTPHAVQLVPAVLGSILGQGIKDPVIEVHHVREVTVDCDPPLPMQFDGEVIEGATTPFTLRVVPNGITAFIDGLSRFAQTD